MRTQFAELSATENLHWNLFIILNHHFADFKTTEAIWSQDKLEFSSLKNHCYSWCHYRYYRYLLQVFPQKKLISPMVLFVPPSLPRDQGILYSRSLTSPGLTGEETGDNVVLAVPGTSISTPLAPQPVKHDYGVKLLCLLRGFRTPKFFTVKGDSKPCLEF